MRMANCRLPRMRAWPIPLTRMSSGRTLTLAKLNRNFSSASSARLYTLTYINMLGITRMRMTPSSWTSFGSWLMTWSIRVLTLMRAWFGSVSRSKMTWIVASPALVASEIM
jgi:hypothetical protein